MCKVKVYFNNLYLLWHLFAWAKGHRFDRLQQFDVVRCDQGQSAPSPTGTRRPTHSVDVVFCSGRNVVIDDQLHLRINEKSCQPAEFLVI